MPLIALRALNDSSEQTYDLLLMFFRPPGTLVPKAFCFSRDVSLFFLIRHRISELPRPIATKLYHVITNYTD